MEVYNAIVAYNTEQIGDHWTGRLNIFARDQHGAIVGGIYGFTDRGWLRIEVLIVKDGWRGQGMGTRLLAAAEAEARRRHLPALRLSTRLVLADNRRLFAACGFIEGARHAHPGSPEPTFVDMEKRLG